ncbi:unnamed protein product [Peniophora sp. CBMAI 1063]|nr:unnamed protein product [Peniophora sp. CBMAI 1063]
MNGDGKSQADWTKSLVQLARNAELKKNALALQIHTAHILAAHASLDAKEQEIQDVKEQKNKLDSERARLLACLVEVNADRDKMDMKALQIEDECSELRKRIDTIKDGEYIAAKTDVDKLREELGHPPLQSLQSLLDEKSQQYLQERLAESAAKRTADEASLNGAPSAKRRGRPKGSRNKKLGEGEPSSANS